MTNKHIYLAGGCFWGTEHFFKQIAGVVETEVGFANGRQYVSGNNCERVYSNEGTTARKGINMFEEKYHLLFNRTSSIVKSSITIGIPRGLGIYENYPFWQTLFECCGMRVRLSGMSTTKLFDKGVRTIVRTISVTLPN